MFLPVGVAGTYFQTFVITSGAGTVQTRHTGKSEIVESLDELYLPDDHVALGIEL